MAQFIERGLAKKGVKIIIYIDDALLIAPHDKDPHALLREVMDTIRSLSLPLAYEKIVPYTEVCISWHNYRCRA